jgi:hypothetical protein
MNREAPRPVLNRRAPVQDREMVLALLSEGASFLASRPHHENLGPHRHQARDAPQMVGSSLSLPWRHQNPWRRPHLLMGDPASRNRSF